MRDSGEQATRLIFVVGVAKLLRMVNSEYRTGSPSSNCMRTSRTRAPIWRCLFRATSVLIRFAHATRSSEPPGGRIAVRATLERLVVERYPNISAHSTGSQDRS